MVVKMRVAAAPPMVVELSSIGAGEVLMSMQRPAVLIWIVASVVIRLKLFVVMVAPMEAAMVLIPPGVVGRFPEEAVDVVTQFVSGTIFAAGAEGEGGEPDGCEGWDG